MLVELMFIDKSFGKVHANKEISLTIKPGSIQGILGENGAGKSTLMKILSGFIQADSGKIVLDGKPIKIHAPSDAIKYGVGMLHQDPLDFPPLRVIDNFIAGQTKGLIPDRRKALKAMHEMQIEYGFSLDPLSYVDSLTVGERQQLEIMRLLWLGASILILDEPTTGISSSQKEKLFQTLKKLASQGKTVLFVSHKLEEVEGLCTQVAVLARGSLVGQTEPPYSTEKLVQMMFGKNISQPEKISMQHEDCTLTISKLAIEDTRLRIKNVDLEIHCGEIIGLAGMEGSGQGQFLRTLAGLIRPVGGKIILNGKNLVGRSYRSFRNSGITFVPASRLEEGLIPGLTLTEHFALAEEQGGFFINWKKVEKLTNDRIDEFSIRGTSAHKIEALSGGNQQRALLALIRNPLQLLLLEHPTRGLDIESTIYIWSKLKERCRQGASIIFISSDLDEILRYSDRILVFFGGRVSPWLDANATSVDQLGQLIGGKGW